MKTASIIVIFALVLLSYTIMYSSGTLIQFGSRHEARQTDSLNLKNRISLKAKRTTVAGKSLNSRPTVHPHFTTQTRPVDRSSTSRRNLKLGPFNIFSLRKQSTVHSGHVTSPQRSISIVTGSKISVQRTKTMVTSEHHLVTSSHVKAFVGHNSVTGVNTNMQLSKSQSANSVHLSIKTGSRNDTISSFGNTTPRPTYRYATIRNFGNTTVRPTYRYATIRNFGNTTVRPTYSYATIRNFGNTTVRHTYRTTTIRNLYNTTDKYRTATISNIGNTTTQKSYVLDMIKYYERRNKSSSLSHFLQELAHNESTVPGDSNCPTFVCDDGHVLSGGFMVCDGVEDCSDGSDEINADDKNCSDSKVPCSAGVCINQYMAGAFPEICEPTEPAEVDVKTTVSQSDSDFQCGNTLQRVKRTDVCDGVVDCADGSDETSCPCLGFQCKNGKCVLGIDKCDGVDDCGDKSDEHDCPIDKNPRSCSGHFASGRFQCGDGFCVEKSSMCDNVFDCWDHSDEKNSLCHPVSHQPKPLCGISDFVCSNGKCINKDKRCDGLDDCVDHSDENFCYLDLSSRFHTILAYSLGGVGAIVFLVILIGTIVYCHKKKRHVTRTAQMSMNLKMRAAPSTSGSSIGRTGVSFENPLSELKSQY